MKIKIIKKIIFYADYIQFQEKARKKRWESVLFLEHPPTLTAGTESDGSNLLVSQEFLKEIGVDIVWIRRGGDFTAHEPGQLVIYPHIDLKKRNIKVMDFILFFRGAIIESVKKAWGLVVVDSRESPGLYLKENPSKKLVSFGINFKSYFTSFGAAINISNSLETFKLIHPCGGLSENMVSIQSLGLDVSKRDLYIHSLAEKLAKLN